MSLRLTRIVRGSVLPAMPLTLSIYAFVALEARATLAGMMDTLSFVLLVTAFLALVGRFVPTGARLTLFCLSSLALSTFFVGNTHYYLAFHDWMRHDVLAQWRLGSSVAGGFVRSIGVWDLIAGIALPLLWAGIAGRRRTSVIQPRSALALAIVLTATVMGHASLTRGEHDPGQQHVMMNFGREWIRDARSVPPPSILDDVRIWDYFPRPAEGFTTDSRPVYPLMKLPDSATGSAAAGERPPNVVLVLMESVRALESGAYGAPVSFTPQLDRLADEGLLFTDFYANGTQTVRGELSVLCSFHPDLSGPPIYRTQPYLGLSCLPSILARQGYATSWISGYTKSYAGKFRFLSAHGIEHFYDDKDFPEDVEKLGWGVSDEEIFRKAEAVLDRQPEPFFAEIMTLSNHWPFDWPYATIDETPVIAGDPRYVGYTRGIYYTDWAIGRFMERMRGKPYFENTIFAFVGDHGIWIFPDEGELKTIQKQEAYFRMPFVLYAPALIEAGRSSVLGSQVDFAPTVLDLLGIKAKNSFAGQSLVAPAGELERHALMMHVRQWNLRIGDRYLYDVSREFFEEHFPQPPEGYVAPEGAEHVYLETAEDLLRLRDPRAIRFGDERQRLAYTDWAERLVALNQEMLRSDRVFGR